MNPQRMRATAERAGEVMKSLSHPKRLLILCQLAEGEVAVGELARRVGLREPAVSQQLALLRKDRMVAARREGQSIYYALARDDIRALIGFLYDTYCREPRRRRAP